MGCIDVDIGAVKPCSKPMIGVFRHFRGIFSPPTGGILIKMRMRAVMMLS